MGFLQLLRSLDELLYEVMSWLVFYPITLWRSIFSPHRMMAYSSRELGQDEAKQYTDTLSPPLFLLLSLVLSHAIELAVIGQSAIVTDKRGLAGLVDDDSTLILLRLAIFSLFPLVMAARMVRKRHQTMDRDTLKAPFYAQCYPAGPFALLLGIGSTCLSLKWPSAHYGGMAMILIALAWYGIFQAFWFAERRDTSLAHGFWDASVGMAECLICAGIVGALFV